MLVSDLADRTDLEDSAREAEALGASLVFGPQTPALLDGADLVVASPAIPFDHPVLTAAAERGVPATTEMNLFLERVRAPRVRGHGHEGQVDDLFAPRPHAGGGGRRVHYGGNVGRALLGRVDDVAPGDLVVLELSSFQLWWTRRIARAPHVAVVTNLFPDHLDRHGTFADYAEAKRAILDFQGPGDVAVLPADDPAVVDAGFTTAGRGRRVTFGDGGDFALDGATVVGPDGFALDLAALPLWGTHNLRNAMAAAAAAQLADAPGGDRVDVEALARGAASARPLPHRLAPVAEVDGVLYVDDSNATNPESTLRALEAVPRPVVVLVGGKEKGLDPTTLLEGLSTRARAVVGIGTTGPDLVRRLEGRVPTDLAAPDPDGTAAMASAVRRAARIARPGDAVLLSPAHSSLDQFPSFVARARAFEAAVRALSDDAAVAGC